MLIGRRSEYYLKKIQAKSKMFEYDTPEDEHIKVETKSNDLVILSIAIIGDISDEIWKINKSPILISDDKKSKLYFASRFFDSYFQAKLYEEMNPYYILLGAVAYYYCDMIGSSQVMIKILSEKEFDFQASGLEKVIIWLLDNKKDFEISDVDKKFREYIEKMKDSYRVFFEGEEITFEEFEEVKSYTYKVGTPRELLFIDIILAIFKKKICNSCMSLMPIYSGLPKGKWLDALKSNIKIKELWPTQILLGENEIFKGKSSVIQMPTSSGKTTSIALAIQSSFLSNKTEVVIIVAPFRALCKEIIYDLEIFFGFDKNIKINEFSDIPEISAYKEFTLEESENKKILVLTPEKLIYILKYNQNLIDETNMIIFDEAHLFDDESRGTDYELLLTTINNYLNKSAQKIIISAVIPNSDKINEWLNNEGVVIKNNTIRTSEKTVAFNTFINSDCNYSKLFFVDPIKELAQEFYVPRVVQKKELKKLEKERKQRMFPSEENKEDLGIFYSIKLISKGAVAIFCARKSNVGTILKRYIELEKRGISLNRFVNKCRDDENVKIAFLIKEHYDENSELYYAAQKGILGHHSGIPNGIKISMEYALRKGLINCVVCTSTLAQGVNIPIKYLMISNIYQTQALIKVRDFHNLIGRTGRAGQQTEGTILITENIYNLKDKDAKYRLRNYKYLLNLGNTEECGSNLLKLVRPSENLEYTLIEEVIKMRYTDLEKYNDYKKVLKEAEKKEALYEISNLENILLALESYIISFVDLVDLNEDIVKQTYGYFLANEAEKKRIISIFNLIKLNLDSISFSKKIMYSKAMLGIIKMKKLEEFVEKYLKENFNPTFESLIDIIVTLLLNLGDCKTILKIEPKENLRQLLGKWLNGEKYSDIFEYGISNEIKINKRNKLKNIEIKDIVELCNNDFSYSSLVLIQATIEILETLDYNKEAIDLLKEMIVRIRYGLATIQETYVYELGFSDRVITQKISEYLSLNELTTKRRIKAKIKENKENLKQLLKEYPSYFLNRLKNI